MRSRINNLINSVASPFLIHHNHVISSRQPLLITLHIYIKRVFGPVIIQTYHPEVDTEQNLYYVKMYHLHIYN